MDVSGIWHSQEKEKMMIDPFCPLRVVRRNPHEFTSRFHILIKLGDWDGRMIMKKNNDN